MLKRYKVIAVKKTLLTILCTFTLSACSIYKTREFVQQDMVQLENWNVYLHISAFTGSSSASWDNNSFTIFCDVSTYKGEYRETAYTSNISNFKLFTGKCPGLSKLEMGLLNKKTYVNDRNRVNISANNSVIIPTEIEYLCGHVDIELTSIGSSKKLIKNGVQIGMKRHEAIVPFFSMY